VQEILDESIDLKAKITSIQKIYLTDYTLYELYQGEEKDSIWAFSNQELDTNVGRGDMVEVQAFVKNAFKIGLISYGVILDIQSVKVIEKNLEEEILQIEVKVKNE